MQQRFIELGEGYSDIYELFEIMSTNSHRIFKAYVFAFEDGEIEKISLAVSLTPATADSNFMPIYICREGIKLTANKPSKRYDLFMAHAKSLDLHPVRVEVKHSSQFAENELYYQYITGILRLNHLLPPLK
ncbi:methylthioribose kinase [Sporosarcina sp. GW1-11]|nr:methylthioribose kinase [Sporosarcina sp. GW1-11]